MAELGRRIKFGDGEVTLPPGSDIAVDDPDGTADLDPQEEVTGTLLPKSQRTIKFGDGEVYLPPELDVILEKDGTYTFPAATQAPPPDEGGSGFLASLVDLPLAFAQGGASAFETLGALAEATVAPELGERMRQSGISAGDFIKSYMTPEMQVAVERSFLELSSENALLSPRAWAAGILQTVPYMMGTGGVGLAGAAGARLLGAGAKTAARIGFGGAGAAAGAGEAAAGAGQLADQRGLSEEDRLTGMRAAVVPGAVAGLALGKGVEAVFGAKTAGRALIAGAAGEAAEEGGTQAAAEFGNTVTGGDFSVKRVAEATIGGAALGGVSGAIVNKIAGEGKPAEPPGIDQAEADALTLHEVEKQRAIREGRPPPTPPNVAASVPGGASPGAPTPTGATVTPENLSAQISYRTAEISKLKKELKDDPKVKGANGKKRKIKALQEEVNNFQSQLGGLQPTPQAKPIATGAAPPPEGGAVAEAANNVAPGAQPPFLQPQASPGGLSASGLLEPAKPPMVGNTDPPLPDKTLPLTPDEIQKAEQETEQFDESPAQESPVVKARVEKAQAATARKVAKGTPSGAAAVDPRPTATAKTTTPSSGAEASAIAQTLKRKPQKAPAAEPPPTAPVASPAPVVEGGASPVDGGLAAPPQPVNGPDQVVPSPAQPPGPFGPIDPRVPQPRPQEGVNSVPNTLNGAEHTQQKLAERSPELLQVTDASLEQGETIPALVPSAKPKKAKPLANMTPVERLTMLLSDGPKDVNTVLAAMQDAFSAQKDSGAFRLIERLRGAFPAVKGKANLPMVAKVDLSNGFQGLYDPRDNLIQLDLNQAEDAIAALLHETIHAATIGRLRLDPKVRQQLERIMADAKEGWLQGKFQPAIDNIDAFRSVEEFVSEALTKTAWSDKFDVVPVPNEFGKLTVLRKLKFALRDIMGVRSNIPPKSVDLFTRLLEFIPDGQYIQEGHVQEWRANMNEFGLTQPNASFTSAMRALLRRNQVAQMIPGGNRDRVYRGLLPYQSLEQIARSHGWLTDNRNRTGPLAGLRNSINKVYELVSQKDGYATKLKAQASRSLEVYKNAISETGADHLDNLLHDARMWSLHPDLPAIDPTTGQPHVKNVFGLALPGGAAKLADLNARWASPKMTPAARDAFNLVRDNATAERNETLLQMILTRLRGLTDAATADAFERQLYDPAKRQVSTFAGVEIEMYPLPSAMDISNMSITLPYNPAKQREIAIALNQVISELGQEQGPYIPLRRYGDFYTVLETTPRVENMTQASLDRFAADNRQKDLLILSTKPVKGTNTIAVKYQFKYVSAHDSETASELDQIKKIQEWRAHATASRSPPVSVPMANISAKSALSREKTYDILGLQSPSIQALRKDIEAGVGGATGRLVSDKIFQYYLEKLPDTSVRKSQLKAKKVAGASRDMLHVLSNHAMGAGYTAAQLKFGHRISRTLNTDIKHDADLLRDNGFPRQANDVIKVGNHMQLVDQKNKDLAANEYFGQGAVAEVWNSLPQVAGAMVLTGPGTALVNSMQVPIMTGSHLGAIHGYGRATVAISGAIKDVLYRSAKETVKETLRFGKNTVKSVVTGASLKTFRDPGTPFFAYITENLQQDEKELINRLAEFKKIDFGITADIQAMAKKRGKFRQAINYVAEGAFILPQAVETTNRTVTALASYRLNKKAMGIAGNPNAVQTEELARLASQDIDRTQWNYSSVNRPLAFQLPAARAFLTFKTYPQAMLYTVMRNLLQIKQGQTPEERKIAAKTLAGIMLGTFTFSGIMGILAMDPLYAVALALAAGLADDGQDPEEALRGWMQEAAGKFWTDALLKGAPFAAGVADTARMGLPAFFPIEDYYKIITDPKFKANDVYAAIGSTVVGPPGSIIEQMITGGLIAAQGDPAKGLAQALPKAFGLNDIARAYNYANNGIVDSRGNTARKPSDITTADWITRTLGFEPPEISRQKTNARSFYARSARAKAAHDGLLDQYAEAVQDRNRDKVKSTIREIRAFNRANPRNAVKGENLRSSLKMRRKAEVAVERFGVNARTPAQMMLAREIEDINPVDMGDE